jgi:hypothetical protein
MVKKEQTFLQATQLILEIKKQINFKFEDGCLLETTRRCSPPPWEPQILILNLFSNTIPQN